MVYWYGTTTEAGASLSARLMQKCAKVATTPSSTRKAPSNQVSATQVNGAVTAPNSTAPIIWVVTSTVSDVPRTSRVQIIKTENARLPAMATRAGHEKLCADGLSAIKTPRNPASTASQRRQPIFSPSRNGDTAVT